MCRMLVSKDKSEKEFEFIIYNIVFSEVSGRFTTEFIYDKLKMHQLEVGKKFLEQLIESWVDQGLIFDDASNYVINTSLY